MPSKSFFLFKYIFRTLHMSSFAIFFGNFLFDAIFGKREVAQEFMKKYSGIFHSSTVILLVSGLINMIILVKENKYVKDQSYKLWKNILVGKFCLTLLLTPILDLILGKLIPQTESSQPLNTRSIKVYLMILIFLVSPFTRFYREYYMTKSSDVEGHAESQNKIHVK